MKRNNSHALLSASIAQLKACQGIKPSLKQVFFFVDTKKRLKLPLTLLDLRPESPRRAISIDLLLFLSRSCQSYFCVVTLIFPVGVDNDALLPILQGADLAELLANADCLDPGRHWRFRCGAAYHLNCALASAAVLDAMSPH
jgi:hypothetical protein